MKTNEKFEKLTKFIKSRNFFIAACVFVLTIFSIGFSYASFFSVKTNSNNQSITTGTLAVSYGNDSSSILRTNLDIMSDQAGMNQSDASVIYIQNTGTLNSTYTLNVGYDMENFTGRSGYTDADQLTPLDYIRIAVYEYNGVNDETLVVGPISMSELPIYSKNNDSRYNRYALLFNTVGSTTSGNATKTYKIKMWLSDKAIPKASYTYFYVNSEIVAEVENAKMSYNLSGILTDTGSTAISGATISLQNGSLVATTDGAGAFTLNGIYPGVYNVDITVSGQKISGNLTVVEESSTSLVSMGSTFTGADIYTVASTYGTTLSKIINKNGFDTYSQATVLDSGTTYILSPTYRLTGGANASISGIKIAVDTSNNVYTMSLS